MSLASSMITKYHKPYCWMRVVGIVAWWNQKCVHLVPAKEHHPSCPRMARSIARTALDRNKGFGQARWAPKGLETVPEWLRGLGKIIIRVNYLLIVFHFTIKYSQPIILYICQNPWFQFYPNQLVPQWRNLYTSSVLGQVPHAFPGTSQPQIHRIPWWCPWRRQTWTHPHRSHLKGKIMAFIHYNNTIIQLNFSWKKFTAGETYRCGYETTCSYTIPAFISTCTERIQLIWNN